VLAVVELIIVFQMRNGKNWARIVLLVLAILQVISAFTSNGSWTRWIGLVAVVIATILMFLPQSNPWFRRNSTSV